MKKIYVVHGYNSWRNKNMIRAFNNENDAGEFMEGLTDPHLQVIAYKSTSDLVNIILNEGKK